MPRLKKTTQPEPRKRAPRGSGIAAKALLKALTDAFVIIPISAATGNGAAMHSEAIAGAIERGRTSERSGTADRAASGTFKTARFTGERRTATAERESNFGRAYKRARYFVARTVDPLGLAPTRAKVYKAIRSSHDDGLTAKQIKSVCRLPHGSVQQTLHWLREHKLVKAAEANLD